MYVGGRLYIAKTLHSSTNGIVSVVCIIRETFNEIVRCKLIL